MSSTIDLETASEPRAGQSQGRRLACKSEPARPERVRRLAARRLPGDDLEVHASSPGRRAAPISWRQGPGKAATITPRPRSAASARKLRRLTCLEAAAPKAQTLHMQPLGAVAPFAAFMEFSDRSDWLADSVFGRCALRLRCPVGKTEPPPDQGRLATASLRH